MTLSGNTMIIAHLGYPTRTFKSSLICNPWFDAHGHDVCVVPMGIKADDYPGFFRAVMRLTNLRGALVTMPHKISTIELVDEVTATAAIAGATNAVLLRDDGTTLADQFDGAGFVRGMRGKGIDPEDKRALVVGSGGVGSAIAASLAGAGVSAIALSDPNNAASEALGERIHNYYPNVELRIGSNDPEGYDVVINATPLGMKPTDPMSVDVDRIAPGSFVGDVVLSTDDTPLLRAAAARGCTVQGGSTMLLELIPAYLEFFGYPGATAEELRASAHHLFS
ncbi:shikimate dehydrogenase family protein [Actinomyces qiguomingii]|uniref:shikimate dehydrogenase family protein n=1 Tax=Actinomyces qiguomingii TaxID=2057800 RepID=UPI000CA06A91|nr:shikimate dehydrogenase [Actinomyces qiguomingii]